MSFFYDLNKKLAALAAKTESKQITESAEAPKSKLAESLEVAEAGYSAKAARAGKDIGKPGKAFAKIAKSAGEKYGSKERGEKVAGAVLNKLRGKTEESSMEMEAGRRQGMLGEPDTVGIPGPAKGTKPSPKAITKGADREYYKAPGLGGTTVTKWRKKTAEEAAEPMTPKQKKFAKLAPPADKITFADKIAGAKKEVDEMLGDVAAEAMRKAVVGHAGEQEMEEGFADMDAWLAQREKEKGTGKFDRKERTLPGGMKATTYTRRHDDDADDAEVSNEPKRRGRPAGPKKAPERVTKGAWKHKGERKVKAEEDIDTDGVMMTRPTNCSSESAADDSAIKSAIKLLKKNGYNVSKKEEVEEKAVSKAQQKFMGMVHAAQKGEKPASKEVAKVAKEMPKKAAKDFAATKHKGLPEKVKAKKESKEEVEETTVAGSVATSTAAPKAGKGMQFGKGVYESLDNKFKQALTESIQVQETMAECGMEGAEPGITIQASGEDAAKLMALLKLAGLGESACPSCGKAPCGCESLEENQPDWPTDAEKLDADPNLRTYSGGLNGPKSTGQTTTPVIASQLRRQASMEESVKLEKTLSDLYKNYKG